MKKFFEELKFIEEAYTKLKENHAFHNSTIDIQTSFLYGLSEKEYEKIDNLLKAIRQDFKKILITMNCIKKNLSSEKNKKIYRKIKNGYIFNGSFEHEISCCIEFLFIKYRVILEYVQEILKICIPHKFNEKEKKEFEKKSSKEKLEYILKYISKNIEENKKDSINEWIKKIIIKRNLITHDGAVCNIYFSDNKDLLFKVHLINGLEKEYSSKEIEYNEFYSYENKINVQYYNNYWGLQISKLIVFAENIFEFILRNSERDPETEKQICLLNMKKKSGIMENGKKFPDVQSVLEEILEELLKKNT